LDRSARSKWFAPGERLSHGGKCFDEGRYGARMNDVGTSIRRVVKHDIAAND
jgi:hypothetical protein